MKHSTFRELNKKQKLQYIWDYYKIHIFVTAALICILFSLVRTMQRNQKADLYVAYVNVAVSDHFLKEMTKGSDLTVSNYTNLLITEDPNSENLEYAYGSAMKVMAAISDGKLDIVVGDRYALDWCHSNEYLDNPLSYIEENPALLAQVEPYLIYDEKGEPYAIDLSFSSYYKEAGFSDSLYLGIIPSEEDSPEVLTYLSLLNR
ncbi:MAG: hypothetical protein J6Z06_03505 [Lachnospiraceae bacterium]|nr:hypothetical protein [Lachnospiraceae bacterium]